MNIHILQLCNLKYTDTFGIVLTNYFILFFLYARQYLRILTGCCKVLKCVKTTVLLSRDVHSVLYISIVDYLGILCIFPAQSCALSLNCMPVIYCTAAYTYDDVIFHTIHARYTLCNIINYNIILI